MKLFYDNDNDTNNDNDNDNNNNDNNNNHHHHHHHHDHPLKGWRGLPHALRPLLVEFEGTRAGTSPIGSNQNKFT